MKCFGPTEFDINVIEENGSFRQIMFEGATFDDILTVLTNNSDQASLVSS